MPVKPYANYQYYFNVFKGTMIPIEEFHALAKASSVILDKIVIIPIEDVTDNVKEAMCYQAEMLYSQGGLDAVNGGSVMESGGSESLGDYSISGKSNSTQAMASTSTTLLINGLPISSLALELLRQDGLMNRWAYYSAYKRDERLR